MLAVKTRGCALIVTCFMVAAASIMVGNQQSEALPALKHHLTRAKSYAVNLVRDKLIKKSHLVGEYNGALATARSRFDADDKAGLLAGKDESERTNHYLRLAVEEVYKLKEQVEMDRLKKESHHADGDEKKDPSLARAGEYDPNEMVQNWNPDEQGDEDLEKSLFAELEDLERQASTENEMGWSMTPEAMASLKARTRVVLIDLLNNEAQQLALVILTNYLTGGADADGSMARLILPIVNGIKFKLAEYFVNAVSDVISAIVGKEIRIIPSDLLNLSVPTDSKPI